MHDALPALVEQVREAADARRPVCIRAGGTKEFYGNPSQGERIDPRVLRGIVAYEPTELVITALAGTPLAEVEALLARHGQMLSFEPPHFGAGATVGGCVAAGLAGPRRASAGTAYGGVRDFVLGARLLTSRGEVLTFGGQVMKNVAGYDVSRLLAGSLGVLGLIVEASIKVLPVPASEATVAFAMDEAAALAGVNAWGGEPLPVSATAWCDGRLVVRLSGSFAGVKAALDRLGGERLDAADADSFWQSVREQTHVFFSGELPLWRLSLPSTARSADLEGPSLIEWGGAVRWLRTDLPDAIIRDRAAALHGHATLFRGGDRSMGVFTPLSPALMAIHQRLKSEFDPAGIFNRGRLYPSL